MIKKNTVVRKISKVYNNKEEIKSIISEALANEKTLAKMRVINYSRNNDITVVFTYDDIIDRNKKPERLIEGPSRYSDAVVKANTFYNVEQFINFIKGEIIL